MHRDVTLDQFEREDFSTTEWFNTIVGSQQKVDSQTITTLSTKLQKLCRETSESIETSSNQLTARLPATVADIGAMKKGVADGHCRLKAAVGRLEEFDHREQWVKLSDIDAAKKRVEMGRDALREINQWERRVKELESTIRSGAITNATNQLLNLKNVCEALRVLPEHETKVQRLQRLENLLFTQVRQKAFLALEKSNAQEFQVTVMFFNNIGQPEETAKIILLHFQNAAQKLIGTRNPFEQGASAALVAQTLSSFFEGLTQATQEAVGMGDVMDVIPPVRKALHMLYTRISEGASTGGVQPLPPKTTPKGEVTPSQEVETQTAARGSRAMAVYAAYADGFESLYAVMGAKEWDRLLATKSPLVPQWLLCDIIRFGILPPLRDISDAYQVKVGGSPNDAILRAETSSKKWMQQILTVGPEKAKAAGLGAVAFAWLASVDAVGGEYWSRWNALVDAFGATIKERAHRGFDASLLTSCVQFHDLLKQMVNEINSLFSQQALSAALSLRTSAGPAWTSAVDAADSSIEMELPTVDAVANAKRVVLHGDQAPFPLIQQTMEAIRKRAHVLVTHCCVAPIVSRLHNYDTLPIWTEETGFSATATTVISQVGEDLFALVPMLEQVSHYVMEEWLPIATAFVPDADALVNMKTCLEKLIDPQKGALTAAEQKFEKPLRKALQPKITKP
eukprot:GEMP01014542.1.p1 GENE.GEMP01014542.1~~GEMP01014542.1.p1  ORF type:complete len:681 (+),score=165.38 GEMP01014542.1:49-2091(+)